MKSSLSLVNIFIMKITFFYEVRKCENDIWKKMRIVRFLMLFTEVVLYIKLVMKYDLFYSRLCHLVLRYIYNNFIFCFRRKTSNILQKTRQVPV